MNKYNVTFTLEYVGNSPITIILRCVDARFRPKYTLWLCLRVMLSSLGVDIAIVCDRAQTHTAFPSLFSRTERCKKRSPRWVKMSQNPPSKRTNLNLQASNWALPSFGLNFVSQFSPICHLHTLGRTQEDTEDGLYSPGKETDNRWRQRPSSVMFDMKR